ncbi:NADPH-cytochrome P450 reductase [Hyphodiscus hymeniophilus]|uniref:NADPH-cytochrome P450 reductase n=1 Tax=Hyphodiscus hymeniophilus TaxID=353542 RepID=A0A9P6VI74_9HELO|nr:NADPH-cytochrome P450 reductase [Hyphodiscus hymeniophilus]
MDFRFNFSYKDKIHASVDAMVGFLAKSGARASRPALMNSLMKGKEKTLRADTDYMDSLCEELPQEPAAPAAKDTDLCTDQLPEGQPVIIITASYEGQPPDNAARLLNGCRISVRKHWKMFNMRSLDADISKQSSSGPQDTHKPMFDFEVCPLIQTSTLRQDVEIAAVVETSELTAHGEPSKYHLEIQLPEHMTYECGDYLVFLPMNSNELVGRIMTRFGIEQDSTMVVRGQKLGALPLDIPLLVQDVLQSCVELSDPASKKACTVPSFLNLMLIQTDHPSLRELDHRCLDHLQTRVHGLQQRNLRERNLRQTHQCPRAPRATPFHSLPVQRVPSKPNTNPRPPLFHGLLSSRFTNQKLQSPTASSPGPLFPDTAVCRHHWTYLSTLQPGDEIQVSVRPSAKALFKLPLSTDTPLLILAPALLFVGCRSQTRDRLYAAEFDAWQAQGVVDVRYAFSRESQNSKGCAYVQERLIMNQEDVAGLWAARWRVYVCGSGGFVKEVSNVAKGIVREKRFQLGEVFSEQALETFFEKQMTGRTATDVFG